MPPEPGPLLQARALSRSFVHDGRRIDVLRDVNLDIAPGERLAITGPSGSGKTTLLHILALLDDGFDGELLFDGVDARTLSAARRAATRLRAIGLIFQSSRLVPWLTAEDNVALSHWARDGDRKAALLAARETLHRVGLGERLAHRPAQLSGGEQQRVGVARAIVNQPRVILADEPTGNLDRAATDDVLEVLQQAAAEEAALVIVTHDQCVAARMNRTLVVAGPPDQRPDVDEVEDGITR